MGAAGDGLSGGVQHGDGAQRRAEPACGYLDDGCKCVQLFGGEPGDCVADAVPTDVETASLTVWWWPVTTEAALTRTVVAAKAGSAAGGAAGEAAGGAVDLATLQAIVDGVTPAPGAAAVDGDRQYVILTNENNKVITSLLWARSNAQQWQESTFDLTPYLGRQLRVHIGVYNDGVGGVTAMYADDVAAQFCKSRGRGGVYAADPGGRHAHAD